MTRIHDERVKQVGIAATILMTIMVTVTGLLLGWRFIPGILGEWVGTIMGILTTPFFMEASFVILGFLIVVLLNNWRQHKDGDEFVYLEQVTGPDVPADLPDQAKWAVYREKPLDSQEPSLRDRAEGALAIGDHQAATQWIAAMEPEELNQPDILALRRDLALATGRNDLAAEFESRIRSSGSRNH